MTSNGFLNEYIEKKLIKAEKIGIDQIEKIIKAAEKNLKVAEKLLLIDEGVAYETAYTAMLHAARAFVFIKGYRPTTNFQHKTVVSFTAHFIGDDYKVLIEKFDYMRKNRNKFIYEPWKFHVSMTDTKGALKSAREFIDLIKEEIKKESPQANFKF
ncbi:MAG: HEPN domain-containing protein [Candidatus Omnitrophica bacterium]|nr:HEPN domain-containing protein [Candidatus Omnitrophota bacterium]